MKKEINHNSVEYISQLMRTMAKSYSELTPKENDSIWEHRK